jgi:hypothetical protein
MNIIDQQDALRVDVDGEVVKTIVSFLHLSITGVGLRWFQLVVYPPLNYPQRDFEVEDLSLDLKGDWVGIKRLLFLLCWLGFEDEGALKAGISMESYLGNVVLFFCYFARAFHGS